MNQHNLNAIKAMIAAITPDQMAAADTAMRVIIACETDDAFFATGEDYITVNVCSFAICEPTGADEDYWTVVEDNYTYWKNTIQNEFGEFWGRVAQHVIDYGY